MRTTEAPFSRANLIDGSAAAMRAVLVMAPVTLSCRDVEIDAHEHAFAGEVEVADGFEIGHGKIS